MKKVFKLLLVILTGFVFVSTLKVSADETPLTLVKMLEGAQIRTTGEQGLRFTAQLNGDAKEHGFYLVYGTPSQGDLDRLNNFVEGETKINDKEVFKVPVPGVDGDNQYSVVLTGIPPSGYLQSITVLPYAIKADNEEVRVEAETRSVYQVARAMLDKGDNVEFANDIISDSGAVTNAEIVYDFTGLEGTGSGVDSEALETILANEHLSSVDKAEKVYDGNGSGGTYPNTPGMLKFGTGTVEGELHFTLSKEVLIKTVVVFAEGWQAGDKMTVNGVELDLTQIYGDRLVFKLNDETNVVEIETEFRAFVFGLELYGQDVGVPATEYVEVTVDYGYEDKADDVFEMRKGLAALLDEPSRGGYTFEGWVIGEVPYVDAPITDDVTILATWEAVVVDEYIEDAEIVYDFSTLEGKGTERNATWWSDFFKHEYLDAITHADKAYDGNGSGGGIYASTAGLIKFGTSSVGGKLTFKFNDDVLIKTVVLYIDGWTNSDKLVLNGQSYDLELNDNSETPAKMIIAILDDATSVVELVVEDRAFLLGIEFYGPEVSPTFYEVTFNSDGGSAVNTQLILEGEKAVEPKDPTKSGYDFVEWQLNKFKFNFNTPITSDITLVAIWEEAQQEPEPDETLLMIYEAYGGGGNSGAPYKYDYVVLYNASDEDISLVGYSLQQTSAAGTSYNVLALNGTIVSEGYYLIQLAGGTYGSESLPFIPNIIGSFNMAAADFKLALVSGTNAITGIDDTTVVDFLGGGEANQYEGSSAASGGSNTKSLRRKTLIDTNDNGEDFEAVAVNLSYLEGFLPAIIKYTVTFNSDGGSTVDPQTVIEGEKATEPANVTKTGYNLEGWYKEPGFTTKWNFGTDTVTSNITLYAKWVQQSSNEPILDKTIDFGTTNQTGYGAGTLTANDITFTKDRAQFNTQSHENSNKTVAAILAPITGAETAFMSFEYADVVKLEFDVITWATNTAIQSSTATFTVQFSTDGGINWTTGTNYMSQVSKTKVTTITITDIPEGVTHIKFYYNSTATTSNTGRAIAVDNIKLYKFPK